MKKRYVIVNDSGYFLTKGRTDHFNSEFKPKNVFLFITTDKATQEIDKLIESDRDHLFYSIRQIYLK